MASPHQRGHLDVKIGLTSILVDDQDKASDFYTRVLGFVKKTEIPMREHRWLTLVHRTTPTVRNWCWSLTGIQHRSRRGLIAAVQETSDLDRQLDAPDPV